MVTKCHSVPQNGPVTRLVSFSVPVLANHILDCVELRPAMISIDNNLRSSYFALFVPVHQVIAVLWLDCSHLMTNLPRS